MSDFIRILPKLGGSAMVKGINFKFTINPRTPRSSPNTPSYYLLLSIGPEVQEHLGLKAKDRVFIGYHPDNCYHLELTKAKPNDNTYKITSNGAAGLALNVRVPWRTSTPPDEALSCPRRAKYKLKKDCVEFDLIFSFED